MSTLLKDIPQSEKPRERLLTNGAENLSNEELLSILLRTGVRGHSVSDLSREILSKIESIKELKDLSLTKFKSIRGLGETKSVTVLAALELGRRVYEQAPPQKKIQIKLPVDVHRYFSKYIVHEHQENFMAIFVDNHRRYISHKIIFKGTLDSSLVHPREVFKLALLNNAAGVIIMHNHPSGVTLPSKADDATTTAIAETGNTIGIPLLDHLIVGESDYYSYVEEGRMTHE